MKQEDLIAREVFTTCLELYRELGPGLFESVYEAILAEELNEQGFDVSVQKILPIYW